MRLKLLYNNSHYYYTSRNICRSYTSAEQFYNHNHSASTNKHSVSNYINHTILTINHFHDLLIHAVSFHSVIIVISFLQVNILFLIYINCAIFIINHFHNLITPTFFSAIHFFQKLPMSYCYTSFHLPNAVLQNCSAYIFTIC